MNEKVLVGYATWGGSTAEVAEKVAEGLRLAGFEVDVLPAKKVKDLTGYRAVVLGSAARIGRLKGDARGFVRRHRKSLAGMPAAYFVVCLTMKIDSEKSRETVSGYLAPLRAVKAPVAEGMFAGVFEVERLKDFVGAAMAKSDLPRGDFRKWDEIEAWTQEVAGKFKAAI